MKPTPTAPQNMGKIPTVLNQITFQIMWFHINTAGKASHLQCSANLGWRWRHLALFQDQTEQVSNLPFYINLDLSFLFHLSPLPPPVYRKSPSVLPPLTKKPHSNKSRSLEGRQLWSQSTPASSCKRPLPSGTSGCWGGQGRWRHGLWGEQAPSFQQYLLIPTHHAESERSVENLNPRRR